MDWMTWYNGLVKPSWTPAPSTIGLVWQILYPIILLTFASCSYKSFGEDQLVDRSTLCDQPGGQCDLYADSIWNAKSALASVDILVVWSTIIWLAVAIWPYYRWVAIAQVPYFLWVSIATYLQLFITWNNR